MSDASTSLKAINCTTCGGTLPALAGNKAKALVCGYCGSVMDRHDDYKVLQQYKDMRRPLGPLSIGMTGEVMGTEHMVIGIVGVKSVIEGAHYYWTDYQLYSATHGYSWLTWNNGHFVHSRSVRGDIPTISNLTPKTEFIALDRTYKLFESYEAEISYIEGELTWLPTLGEKTKVSEGIAPPYGFASARGGKELGFEAQTYLDVEETLTSFGVTDITGWMDSPGPHPMKPFTAPLHRFASYLALAFLALVVALGFYLSSNSDGTVIAEGQLTDPAAGLTLSFDAPGPSTLMAIDLTTDGKVPADRKVRYGIYNFVLENTATGWKRSFSETTYYYDGVDQNRLRTAEAGPHTLTVVGVPKYTDDPLPKPATIKVRQGLYAADPVFLLAWLFGLIALSLLIRKLYVEYKRWEA